MEINPQFVIDSLMEKVTQLTQELIIKDAQIRQFAAEKAAAEQVSQEAPKA